MKKVQFFTLLILNLVYSEIIIIPDDFQTIQTGIETAAYGDTVLVLPGEYVENLIIDKAIILAGSYLLNGNHSSIENTVINGSNSEDEALGSTIFVTPPEGGFETQPHIIGLTVSGGSGTHFTDINGIAHIAGGGVFIHNCTPTLNYVHFRDNGLNESTVSRVDKGGAIYINIDESITFDQLSSYSPWIGPYVQVRNEIDLDWCKFENNFANIGKSIVANGFDGIILTTNIIFDVFNSNEAAASSYWVTADDDTEFDFFCSSGMIEALTMPEIHIHEEDGSNETGNGSDDSPFRDIAYALSLAYGTEEHPVTIHLDNVRNRRDRPREMQYPLQMVDHVSLKGEGDRSTVLDADDQSKILLFENVNGVKIDSLKLSHGRDVNHFGGAVYINESNPRFTSVTFDENEGIRGGALYVNRSEPIFEDVELIDNVSERGGGIYIKESNVVLSDIELSDNEVISTRDEFENGYGGGFFLDNSCIDADAVVIQNNTVLSNNGSSGGGAIYGSMPEDEEDYYCQNEITLELSNVIINGNTAETGSGIYLKNVSSSMIDFVQITGNVMTESNANGVIYLNNSANVNLDHLTISGNYANGFAPVMYMAYSNAIISNSIVFGNGSAIPLPWSFYCQEASQLTIQFSDIENGVDAIHSACEFIYDESNINPADPLFVEGIPASSNPSTHGDFHLQPESPCINAGDPEYPFDADGTITDLGMYPCENCGDIEIEGCTDEQSCNYDPQATIDDGSCEGPEENHDCEGNCIVEMDCAGICGGPAEIDECGVCDGGGVVQDCGCGLPGEYGIPDGACDCDGNILDCSGDCGGEAILDDCGICSGDIECEMAGNELCPPGDAASNDDLVNILDVVLIVQNILQNPVAQMDCWQKYIADMDSNCEWSEDPSDLICNSECNCNLNIVDVVLLVNLILSREYSNSIESAHVYLAETQLKHIPHDGLVYDIRISHSGEKPIELTLSEDILFGDFISDGISTRVIIINPASELLFTANMPFEINLITAAFKDQFIDVNIVDVPEEFSIITYPNPFNPALNIDFSMPVDDYLKISIFNIQGKEVSIIYDGDMKAGEYSFFWTPERIAAGLYFISAVSGEFNSFHKIMYLK